MIGRNKLIFYARRALWIFIAWVTLSLLIFFYEYVTLISHRALTSDYDLTSALTAYLIVSVSASIIGGVFTVNLMEYWLRRFAFWKALVLIIIVYTIVSLFLGSLGSLYLSGQELELPMFHEEVVEELFLFYGKAIFLKNYFLWLLIVLVTLVVLMVNDKYGPGVFPDYLKGRYFRPKRERRIFMFADIKDATTIAEVLGEAKYFNFLKDFFKYIAPAIIETKGEVYQYVGDEIVVSWKIKKGLDKGNALRCFYKMKELIEKKSEHFQKHYDCVPQFKVGYHYGAVMVGEIGQIKRDIAFSGDVLNTTSRIQSKCNELGVDILISEEFLKINYILPEGIIAENLGEKVLKGKAEKMNLVTFRNEI
ncbi:MAG: adenylate/guanylate cyclase domain-containing protein [Flavobacteriaceae bacterium]|nr:adenylate/guanylate cyclase domain-containing protein [Flavobacteriaceae bacterium]